MKYRLLDLLLSPETGARLRLNKVSSVKKADFAGETCGGKCTSFCGFKNQSIAEGEVTAADCRECYSVEIEEGELVSETGERYAITGGIPRLVTDATARFLARNRKTFSLEWKYSDDRERNWGQDIEFRKGLFLKGFDVEPHQLAGKLILDAGCGSGLLSRTMAKDLGMEVVALDLATGIERAHAANSNPYVHFVQGSVLELPLRNRVFDYVYCAGVLIHLPDTRIGFEALPRVLKRGGRMFVWVYRLIETHSKRSDRLRETVYQFIRSRITSRLPIVIQEAVYRILIIPFLVKRRIFRLFGRTDDRSWKEKMQNLIDTFSPVYVNRHSEEEVLSWYRQNGFANCTIAYDERYGFGARGDLVADSPGEDPVSKIPGDVSHRESATVESSVN